MAPRKSSSGKGKRGKQPKAKAAAKPFIGRSLRPDLTIRLDASVASLSVRELVELLAPQPTYAFMKIEDEKALKDRSKESETKTQAKDIKDANEQKSLQDAKQMKDAIKNQRDGSKRSDGEDGDGDDGSVVTGEGDDEDEDYSWVDEPDITGGGGTPSTKDMPVRVIGGRRFATIETQAYMKRVDAKIDALIERLTGLEKALGSGRRGKKKPRPR